MKMGLELCAPNLFFLCGKSYGIWILYPPYRLVDLWARGYTGEKGEEKDG